METTATVAYVESKRTTTGKDYKAFVDGDGKRWNVFPRNVAADQMNLLIPGNVLKLTWEYDKTGKYENIMSMEFMQKVEPPKVERPLTAKDDQAATNLRTAVMQSLECWRAGKLRDDNPLVLQALEFCGEWMNVQDAKPDTQDAERLEGLRKIGQS